MANVWVQYAYARSLSGLRFPVDMLRYDSCFPALERDSSRIGTPVEVGTVVHLTRVVGQKDLPWALDRWLSFGWELVEEPVRNLDVDW